MNLAKRLTCVAGASLLWFVGIGAGAPTPTDTSTGSNSTTPSVTSVPSSDIQPLFLPDPRSPFLPDPRPPLG